MNKSIFLFLSVLILGVFQVSAQNSFQTPIEVSKDKIRIDGTVYYVHVIRQGQTLYSISKAYDVAISEIEKSNPPAKNGLKVGAFLYVPVSGTAVSAASSLTGTAGSAAAASHKPKPEKEKKQKKEKKKKDPSQTEYKYRYRHRTETDNAGETAAVAPAAATNPPASQIAAAPAADGPVADALDTGARPTAQHPVTEPETATPEPARKASVSSDLYVKSGHNHTVSLVMPFGKSARYGASEINQSDFYSGALLALYDLRQDSRYSKYVLNVIDLDNWDTAEDMLPQSGISESALIIGPVTLRDVTPVARYAGENRIPMVSPLDIRTASLAAENPYLFIYPSSAEAVQTALTERFFSNVTDETLIVISEKGKMATPTATMAAARADSTGIAVRNYSYAILENTNVNEDLLKMIPEADAGKARILVASEDEAFVADALRNLNVLVTTEKRNLTVYGLPKWRNFGSLQLEYLHNLNTHICLSYYLDYSDTATLGMTERFEEIYHTSPTPFAYQGYDITKFFIEALENYGSAFPVEIMDTRHSTIQSDVEFHKAGDGGGFYNSAVRSIIYHPDWTIECEQ